jgi:cytosine/adenosine deaminase-related metal-dependent hydrolase
VKKLIILKNCLEVIAPKGKENLKGVDIVIKDNRIFKIGSNLHDEFKEQAEKVIDCSTMVVSPGLVNTHHHFYQTLTRNLPAVQDAELFDWLVYLYDVWKNIDGEAIYYSSLLALAELAKTGCTCSTDHHYVYPMGVKDDLMQLQFDAAEKIGVRFSPTRGSMSLSKKDGGLPPDSVVQTEDEILKDSLRVIEKFHDNSELSMRKVVLAPCSPFSVTKDLMKESSKLARQYGVNLHTHVAETHDENDFCKEIYGKRPLALMEECGFVGKDVFYAHGIHFNDDEMKILQETGTTIAHCPNSNMRLGSGICRVKEMLEMGINVSLAVDGSASNDSSDMLGELRAALMLQRVAKGANAITAKEVFTMATENGAKALNFEKVGKIEEGWAADLALFNIDKLEYTGSHSDPMAAVIFCGYNHEAAYTIANGKIIVENGKLTGFDENVIKEKANKIAANLLNK